MSRANQYTQLSCDRFEAISSDLHPWIQRQKQKSIFTQTRRSLLAVWASECKTTAYCCTVFVTGFESWVSWSRQGKGCFSRSHTKGVEAQICRHNGLQKRFVWKTIVFFLKYYFHERVENVQRKKTWNHQTAAIMQKTIWNIPNHKTNSPSKIWCTISQL